MCKNIKKLFALCMAGTIIANSFIGQVLPVTTVYATESITEELRAEIEASLYDFEYYCMANEDVAVALGYDEEKMYEHWLNFGMAEGRNASMVFNAKYYLEVNPEVKALVGNDYIKAYEHFVTTGLLAGLESSPVFSVKYYLEANQDVAQVFGNDYVKAANHFNQNALAEGRSGSGNFDYTVYRYCNTDVADLYGDEIKGYYIHYINHGRTEGRTAGLGTNSGSGSTGGTTEIDENAVTYRIFDAEFYLEKYPELRNTVGIEETELYLYWLEEGIEKGQTASPVIVPEEYLKLNQDVGAVFGDDKAGALKHFLNYGILEGRTGSYEFDYSIYAYCNTDVGDVFSDDIVGYYFHYVKYGKAENRTAAAYIPPSEPNITASPTPSTVPSVTPSVAPSVTVSPTPSTVPGVTTSPTLAPKRGDGTTENPYQIRTAEELQKISEDLSAAYILMNDIDLSTYQNGKWESIGAFSGVFDGNGFSICNFEIVTEESHGTIGLFNEIEKEGKVKNLAVINVSLNAGFNNGGIVTGTNAGKIENCYVKCKIKGDVTDNNIICIGGIAGYSTGIIENCIVVGNASDEIYYDRNGEEIAYSIIGEYVGGIVGYNEGEINSCYSYCNVLGCCPKDGCSLAGGIVGRNEKNGVVKYCKSFSKEIKAHCLGQGGTACGGICGSNAGILIKNYFIGSLYSIVDGASYYGACYGGIVGNNGDRWFGYGGKVEQNIALLDECYGNARGNAGSSWKEKVTNNNRGGKLSDNYLNAKEGASIIAEVDKIIREGYWWEKIYGKNNENEDIEEYGTIIKYGKSSTSFNEEIVDYCGSTIATTLMIKSNEYTVDDLIIISSNDEVVEIEHIEIDGGAYVPVDESEHTAMVYLNLKEIGSSDIFISAPDGTYQSVSITSKEAIYNIKMYSLVPVLTIGKETKTGVAVQLERNGIVVEDEISFHVVSSNSDVVSISDIEKNIDGTFFYLNGVSEGTAIITVTENMSDTVYSTTVQVNSGILKYNAEAMPEYFDGENVCNGYIDGLYIDEFVSKEGKDSKLIVSFNVYNTTSRNGAVNVYNAKGELIHSEMIERFSDNYATSIKDTFVNAYKLLEDFWDGDFLTYKQASYSKCTPIKEIEVPKGGHIEITNNLIYSSTCAVYNLADFVTTSILMLDDAIGLDAKKVEEVSKSTAKGVVSKIFESYVNAIEGNTVAEKINELGEKFAEEIVKKGMGEIFESTLRGNIATFVDSGKIILKEIDLDSVILSSALDVGVSIGEDKLKSAMGLPGVVLSGMFKTSEYLNYISFIIDICTSDKNKAMMIYFDDENDYLYEESTVDGTKDNCEIHSIVLSNGIDLSGKTKESLNKYETQYAIRDIYFLKEEAGVINKHLNIQMIISVPEEYDIYSCKLYWVQDDGSLTELDTKIVNGNLSVIVRNSFVYGFLVDRKES